MIFGLLGVDLTTIYLLLFFVEAVLILVLMCVHIEKILTYGNENNYLSNECLRAAALLCFALFMGIVTCRLFT